ncbi:MAG: site-specific DNA-methyltransferase [Syntrophorhabdus sp.]|nr:site-specific DNA-methyltransferase [Syntrophorhabdus sp.]
MTISLYLRGDTVPRGKKKAATAPTTESYQHTEAGAVIRPEVGVQAQFKKKKSPQTYDYDSSLSPQMCWDDINSARDVGEWLITMIDKAACLPPPHRFSQPEVFKDNNGKVLISIQNLDDALEYLKKISQPFLNWSGKREHISFDVPTLPLFIHERLSTKAILETLKRKEKTQQSTLDALFGDPRHPITDQVLKAYEYSDDWTNRLILGDSLVVMNSLLQYEGMGGQVQMIYMDPPYGIKFGSNFQPFVRPKNREVPHNSDEDFTREPEMVKAYRDTWELGLHSYLTYLRDRILLSKYLLSESGSIFVQISNENLHQVRDVMDEVFGSENFICIIVMKKTSAPTDKYIPNISDFIIWYAKDKQKTKYHSLFLEKVPGEEGTSQYVWAELPDGTERRLTRSEFLDHSLLPRDSRIFATSDATSSHEYSLGKEPFEFRGIQYSPGKRYWTTSPEGMGKIAQKNRFIVSGKTLFYKRYWDDFLYYPLPNVWTDTSSSFSEKNYVVQTIPKPIQRCLLMTTDPGDLVLDPTCGGGTTAYVAEQWGRRWITIDVSRVPLALTRQRLLTATYPYYLLKNPEIGPAGGFVYERKQNRKGKEIGGIIPHIRLKDIANDLKPKEEVLIDKPEIDGNIIRVTGPFTLEATIPTPVEIKEEDETSERTQEYSSFIDRMIEVLRRSPVLHLDGNRTVELTNIRPPAKALSLSAEALVKNGDEKPVALVFGPENSSVSERLVFESAREARIKGYSHLYVVGVNAQPNARLLIEQCKNVAGIPATYVAITPDIMMDDLLKHMRSSQIFSVCGLPDIKITAVKDGKKNSQRFEVELLGMDTFDPITMETQHMAGDDVPAWFLDTDYNSRCFRVCQAFFPRTGAWTNLSKSLGSTYDDSVWEHLAGATSAPFYAGENNQIAVKVIDDRGNELMVIKPLKGSRK